MPTSIYIHWPFCAKKCHYCDLNSYVDPTHDEKRYVDSMFNELRFYKSEYPDCVIETIFIGGGTPSLMKTESIQQLITDIKKLWKVSENVEVTIEVNPSISADLLGFKSAGINRISIGVQAFQDRILEFLGRDHSVEKAFNTIKTGLKIFSRVSIDIIYGIPGQTIDDIKQTIEYIAQLGLKHVSIYALTIEKNTLFSRKKLELPSENEFCEVYDFITKELPRLGLIQYEISSFSISGEECKHNLIYWKYGNWLPIGPGACGRITKNGTRLSLENIKQAKKWLYEAENKRYAKPVPIMDALQEEFIMKLRINSGLRWEDLQRMDIEPFKLQRLIEAGDIIQEEFGVRLSSEGWLKYNSVIKYLWQKDIVYRTF